MLTSININLYPQQTLQRKRRTLLCTSITIGAILIAFILAFFTTKKLQHESDFLAQQIIAFKQKIDAIQLPINSHQLLIKFSRARHLQQQLLLNLNRLKKIERAAVAGIILNKIEMDQQQWQINAQSFDIGLINSFNKKLLGTLTDLQGTNHGQSYQFDLKI